MPARRMLLVVVETVTGPTLMPARWAASSERLITTSSAPVAATGAGGPDALGLAPAGALDRGSQRYATPTPAATRAAAPNTSAGHGSRMPLMASLLSRGSDSRGRRMPR